MMGHRIVRCVCSLFVLLAIVTPESCEGWMMPSVPPTLQRSSLSTTTQLGAGFGSSKSSGKSKKKLKPLKPKQQWDRYTKMKKADRWAVAIRKKGSSDDDSDWMPVGHVKCDPSLDTESVLAVVRQKALIADHARRLFPGRLSSKDVLEWGWHKVEATAAASDDAADAAIDYSVIDSKDVPDDDTKDKLLGFQGTPDPTTGYYCVYNEGKLVGTGEDNIIQSSKKLQ